MTDIYIPKKLFTGSINSSDTYDGKLARVSYFKDGKKMKEKDIEKWRDNSIPISEIENTPTSFFVLNKTLETDKWIDFEWMNKNSFCRIYDPRGFELEIRLENLLLLISECECQPGKGFYDEFVYGFNDKGPWLLPVNSKEYKSAKLFTDMIDSNKKINFDKIKKGSLCTDNKGNNYFYFGKKEKDLLFMAKPEYDYYDSSSNLFQLMTKKGQSFINTKDPSFDFENLIELAFNQYCLHEESTKIIEKSEQISFEEFKDKPEEYLIKELYWIKDKIKYELNAYHIYEDELEITFSDTNPTNYHKKHINYIDFCEELRLSEKIYTINEYFKDGTKVASNIIQNRNGFINFIDTNKLKSVLEKTVVVNTFNESDINIGKLYSNGFNDFYKCIEKTEKGFKFISFRQETDIVRIKVVETNDYSSLKNEINTELFTDLEYEKLKVIYDYFIFDGNISNKEDKEISLHEFVLNKNKYKNCLISVKNDFGKPVPFKERLISFNDLMYFLGEKGNSRSYYMFAEKTKKIFEILDKTINQDIILNVSTVFLSNGKEVEGNLIEYTSIKKMEVSINRILLKEISKKEKK